ncbi:MAG: hypothetical protein B7Y97_01125 [Sphingomonas sp. 32-66-10]|nr:MAG: hypothetical protein B7Y97_01125 [Sphingomonas sp. 32-66-10]
MTDDKFGGDEPRDFEAMGGIARQKAMKDRFADGEMWEPPRYDWRAFAEIARHAIALIATDVKLDDERKRSRGIDLSKHHESLCRLFAETAEIYDVCRDDWEARNLATIARRLEDNLDDASDPPPYDYSEYSDYGPDDWDAFWKHFYSRRVGQASANRLTNWNTSEQGPRPGAPPPIAPLHPVFVYVERWWRTTLPGKGFNPTYGRDHLKPERPYDLGRSNPAARLVWEIVRHLDERYTIENVTNLKKASERRARRAKKRQDK